MRVCFFSPFSTKPCDGPLQRCHLIPKQRIKRELKQGRNRAELNHLVWHPTVWVWGCERHHGAFDNRSLRVPRSSVPEHTEHFARLFEMEWSLDTDFDD